MSYLPPEFFDPQDTTGAEEPAPVPERVSHYRIQSRIGQGGMGVVYAAEDEKLGRTVAIKMLPVGIGDARAHARLLREARAAASVNHPNICQIYEIGEHGNEPYLVMEMLEGSPLSDKLLGGALSVSESVEITLSLLTALTALHSRGLIHRDLKPANVVQTPHGVKLLDFGLARFSREQMGLDPGADRSASRPVTRSGMIVGTPRYMAPELLEGKEGDHRADLFAVGAMLFEMLSGEPAFPGRTPVEVFHAILYQDPPLLRGSSAIDALNRVVLQALSKSPDERFHSAEALAQDLESVLLEPDVEPAEAARPVKRLMILPFRWLKPETEFEYLSSSLPETITTSLSRWDGIQVRSNSGYGSSGSTEPDFERIAKDASVDSVLTGSLLRGGSQIRMNAQLVQAPSGTVLWSRSSTVSSKDLFALEENLRDAIIDSFQLSDSGAKTEVLEKVAPANPEAYDLYLRGTRHMASADGWREGARHFAAAVEIDPTYAPAWARLARANWLLSKYEFDGVAAYREEAERALKKSLELDPHLPFAVNLRAHMDIYAGLSEQVLVQLMGYAEERKNAADVFTALVLACRFAGLHEASIAAHKIAKRLDPGVSSSVAHTYFQLGEYSSALEIGKPDNLYIYSLVRIMLGEEQVVLQGLREMEIEANPDLFASWMLITVHQLEGNRQKAIEHALRIDDAGFEDREGTFYLARHLAALGEPDKAIELLDKSERGGFALVAHTARDPWLSSIRDRPEFKNILRRAEKRRRTAMLHFFEEGGDRLLGLKITS